MATIRRIIETTVSADAVWEAVADVGALHTRLVPGFVTATELDDGGRRVTFANGRTLREPIVTLDGEAKRLVWSAEGGITTHYNAALEVQVHPGGARLVWTIDFLPDSVTDKVQAAADHAVAAMHRGMAALGRAR